MRINVNIEVRSRNHFSVNKQYVLHILSVCLCTLSYPACNTHAPYYIVFCGLSGHTIFSQIKGKIFEKRKDFVHKMCVLICYKLLSET